MPLTPGFPLTRLHKLREIEKWHFWFVSRSELLSQLLSKTLRKNDRVLELGCGTGRTLSMIEASAFMAIGLDLHLEAVASLDRSGRQRGIGGNAMALPIRDRSVDAVIALDVLEHVDDTIVLGEIQRVLKPGALFVATVPAVPALWSFRDEAAGHLRRYTRRSLRRVVSEAGLHIESIRGFQMMLMPIVLASRMSSPRSEARRDFEDAPPPWLNRILLGINRLELFAGRFVPPPFGSSIVFIARKGHS